MAQGEEPPLAREDESAPSSRYFRSTLQFQRRDAERLERLSKEVCRTKTDTIAEALKVLEVVLEAERRGEDLALVPKDSNRISCRLLLKPV